jgi:predicted GH43/DUF377 family glycosyl hydrolase
MSFAEDRLVVTPDQIDLSRSPLAGQFDAETYVLGAFNPGMTRLANGNLLLMVRVAEALSEPIRDGHVHAIRWDKGRYVLDAWPLAHVDTADPRKFEIHGYGWKVMALTSLSWLLPVEITPDGLKIVAIYYDKAVAPQGSYQCYGIEDARISRVGGRFLMTTCSVSPERHSTTLYSSADGLDWTFQGIVLDHQNKDMLIFEGLIGGQYWAQTRPLGSLFFAYPPGSEYHAGPSINLATSPDSLHWQPNIHPGIRPRAGTPATARIGGGHSADSERDRGKTGLADAVARGRAEGDRRDLPHVLVTARSGRAVESARHQPPAAARSQRRADPSAGGQDVRARRGLLDGHRRCGRSLHRCQRRSGPGVPDHPHSEGRVRSVSMIAPRRA